MSADTGLINVWNSVQLRSNEKVTSYDGIATKGAQKKNNCGVSWTKEGPIENKYFNDEEGAKLWCQKKTAEEYKYIELTAHIVYTYTTVVEGGLLPRITSEKWQKVYHYSVSAEGKLCIDCKQSLNISENGVQVLPGQLCATCNYNRLREERQN